MEKIKDNRYDILKIFFVTLTVNFLQGIKKPTIIILGFVYFLIFICFSSAIFSLKLKFATYDFFAVSMLFNIFSLLSLFVFTLFILNQFFTNNIKSGILKIEQREGVPSYISFIVRILNSFLVLLIFQLPLIIIWNIVSVSSDFGWNFKTGGILSLIDYQPLISIFIMFISLFFVLIFNGYINVLFTLIIALFYSLSPLVSTFALDSKSFLSQNTRSLIHLVPNIELGKNFYQDVSKNEIANDIYESKYLEILNNISNLSNINNKINNISDIYGVNSPDTFKELFYFGDMYSIENASNNIEQLSLYQSLSIFKNYLEPIFKLSSNEIKKEKYSDFFTKDNSIFLQNFNMDLYDKFLSDLIAKLDYKKDQKIYNLVLFMKANINNLLSVYKNTSDEEFPSSDFEWSKSNIILGYYNPIYSYSNDSEISSNIDRNYMLDTLEWEIVTYYNLSLSPTLTDDNNVSNYVETKKFSKSYKNNFDSLFLTNHLYTICNFTSSLSDWENLRYNSYFFNLVAGKLIAKPFSVDFTGDDILSNIIENGEAGNTSKPYSATINLKITSNINVTLLRVLYPLISVFFMTALYFLFRYKLFK